MTTSWRDEILREFTPQVARLTLAADPDGLLLEEGVLQGIRERGFELIPFEDHVAFRYAYEAKFRSRWDRGELTELVVVLRAERQELDALPYDLLQSGRKLSFNLGDLFPNLSYPVIDALDRSDLDALYRAQAQHNPGSLGDNATKDFVLRHVFELTPEMIRQPSDLLRVLLRRHLRGLRVSPMLDERFIQVLRTTGTFVEWALEKIVPDRNAFFAFLQERWPAYLDRLASDRKGAVQEEAERYGFEYDGPIDIAFEHDDVRVYIDNLFAEGLLRPVSHPDSGSMANTWAVAGLQLDPRSDRLRRLGKLAGNIESSLPDGAARHQDWIATAYRWAELNVVRHEVGGNVPGDLCARIRSLQSKLDNAFSTWVQNRYAGLYNQPPVPPVMVHHIPRALSREVARSQRGKIALIIIDGMALDQWIVVRDSLRDQMRNARFLESALFAWVPSTTSVSRQALLAGRPPLYFPDSIHTTIKEPSLWTQFWSDQGLKKSQVEYAKGLGGGDMNEVRELLGHPGTRVVALVVDKVDKIMHGIELGSAGAHNQVRQWAVEGFLAKLIMILHDLRFRTWLGSDHGNVEANGIGRPSEGVLAEERGERVRVYRSQALRARAKERFPRAVEWPPWGLPDEFLALLAPARAAFVVRNQRVVTHGGASLEELVVPFVEVAWES